MMKINLSFSERIMNDNGFSDFCTNDMSQRNFEASLRA